MLALGQLTVRAQLQWLFVCFLELQLDDHLGIMPPATVVRIQTYKTPSKVQRRRERRRQYARDLNKPKPTAAESNGEMEVDERPSQFIALPPEVLDRIVSFEPSYRVAWENNTFLLVE